MLRILERRYLYITCALLAVLVILGMVSRSFGRPCRVVVQKQIVVANAHVAVPFAVPVATPVASVMPGGALYSSNGYASQPPPSAGALTDATQAASADDLALFAEFLRYKQMRQQAMQAKPTAIGTACAGCHGEGANHPKAKLALEHFSLRDLETPEGRLAAMRQVLASKMPPGRPLDADAAGKVLTELAGDGAPTPSRTNPHLSTPDVPQPPKAQTFLDRNLIAREKAAIDNNIEIPTHAQVAEAAKALGFDDVARAASANAEQAAKMKASNERVKAQIEPQPPKAELEPPPPRRGEPEEAPPPEPKPANGPPKPERDEP